MKRSDIKIRFSQALEKYLTAREKLRQQPEGIWNGHLAASEDMQEAADIMDALTSNVEESK